MAQKNGRKVANVRDPDIPLALRCAPVQVEDAAGDAGAPQMIERPGDVHRNAAVRWRIRSHKQDFHLLLPSLGAHYSRRPQGEIWKMTNDKWQMKNDKLHVRNESANP